MVLVLLTGILVGLGQEGLSAQDSRTAEVDSTVVRLLLFQVTS